MTSTLSEIVAAAIKDFETNGYDSEQRLKDWMDQIGRAAEQQATSKKILEQMLREALRSIYDRLVERQGVLTMHPGISRFTLENVKPKLHAELSRRIMASADLIRLNREETIQKTLRRFAGWATSIPAGGSDNVARREAAEDVKKALQRLPFVERRVLIDQGHKLTSSISATVALDGGAIAAKWFSHFREKNYNYREDHKERDFGETGLVYLVRGCWAQERGLIKVGAAGYTDEVTQPAEEPYCRCKWQFLYHVRQLPDDMMTKLGRETLAKVRVTT